MSSEKDIVIVGAGVMGVATAFCALERGMRVAICDRHRTPVGASIRNFGMIWPIGQPDGPMLALAMRSRELWLRAAEDVGFFCRPCGSMHLARHEDELSVLKEFTEREGSRRELELLNADETAERSPGVNLQGLLGGMYSPTELCVEPRTAIPAMWDWLEAHPRVEFARGFEAALVTQDCVRSVDGRTLEGNRIVLSSGIDGARHYPDLFPPESFSPCKLQMLRTVAQPRDWSLGTHIAGGWTLRHYESFAGCPSLPVLKERISREQPEFDRYGIHIMLSQHSAGELIIGDSHDYSGTPGPFDDAEIDRLIIEHARQLVDAPDWTIDRRWHGVYLKRIDGQSEFLVETPEPGITVANALGGAGMSLSFGIADGLVEALRADPREEIPSRELRV